MRSGSDLCSEFHGSQNAISAGLSVLAGSIAEHHVGSGDFPENCAAFAAGTGLLRLGFSGRDSLVATIFLERCEYKTHTDSSLNFLMIDVQRNDSEKEPSAIVVTAIVLTPFP